MVRRNTTHRIDRRSAGRRRGFSLIELLIVVAIIGLLVTLVANNVGGALGESRETTARAMVTKLETSVSEFYRDMKRYPTDQEGLDVLIEEPQDAGEGAWDGPYWSRRTLPADPWGRPYKFQRDERFDFEIVSAGEDGQFDTDDDIRSRD